MKTLQERLGEERQDEKIVQLTEDLKRMLKNSRDTMGKQYPKWDRNIGVYRGKLLPDAEDYEARATGEPEKSIIPLSYAQVQTFVAFGFLLLTQNKRFYEISGTGDEDFDFVELVEKGLARDLLHNQWNAKLYQFLLDLARCSIAPLKHWWTVDTQSVKIDLPEELANSPMGALLGETKSTRIDAIKYEGNRIQNVKPKNFLPDTRKSLTEWESGQFVADEDCWHITNVKELERKGLAFGVKHVSQMTKESWAARGKSALSSLEDSIGKAKDESDYMVALTEGNVRLIPAKYDLGPEDFPILYTFRLANDRLISLEESNTLHDSFNYCLAQFSHDNEAKLNEGLSDTIHALQDTITWLYNSRVSSVRNSMDRHLVVNPTHIDTASLEARSPIIYTRKNAPLVDLRSLVHQLDIRDTTTGHFQDADNLMKTMQFVTGVNENAMGQVSGGRRSATENRAANAGAASRMKVILSCAWDTALGPLGRKLSLNQRQGFSPETFRKIFGEDEKTLGLFERFCPSNPLDLVGNEDFFVFDSTLNSEKGFLAQSLQELVVAVVSNPEFAMTSGFDLQKAMEEIQTLRGLSNVTRFFKTPAIPPGMGPGGAPLPPGSAGQIPGQPPGGVVPAGV